MTRNASQGVTRAWRYGAGLDWLTETSTVGGETLERLQLEDGLYKRARLGNLYKEYLDLGHGVHLVREFGMDGNTLTYESIRPVVHLADLLGSTVATFDAQGNTIADRYYGAFGDERQASGAPTPVPATALALFDDDILRGYTGHHSLSESRLVHMGGRGYDAQLGRFLSPDPAWQMPYSSQSWNRYSYALNSPYRFTDPTGYETEEANYYGPILTGENSNPSALYIAFDGAGDRWRGNNNALYRMAEMYGATLFDESAFSLHTNGQEALEMAIDFKINSMFGDVYIMGYSAGADEAIWMTNELSRIGIEVAGMVTFDPHPDWRFGGSTYRVDNVRQGANFYQKEDWALLENTFRGSAVHGIPNYYLNSNHISIIDDALNNYGEVISDVLR